MLAALLLLGVIGLCAVLGFLSEESIETLRCKVFEAKRWIRLQLDSLGEEPGLNTDSDLEAGFGELCEVPPIHVQHVMPLPLARPSHGGPIRRSVYRSQVGGGVSTHASISPPSEYASLFDRTSGQLLQDSPHHDHGHDQQNQHHYQHQRSSNQQNQQYQKESERDPHLPRPVALSTEIGTSVSATTSASTSKSKAVKRRGTSFDANSSTISNLQPEDRGTEHTSGSVSSHGTFGRVRKPLSDAAHVQAHPAAHGSEDLTSDVVAAFAGMAFSPSSSVMEQERSQLLHLPRPITHRRSSTAGYGAATKAGALSVARPALGGNHGSPFLGGSRSPRRLLPPVPAYDTTEPRPAEAALVPHLDHRDSHGCHHQGGDEEEGQAKPCGTGTGFESINLQSAIDSVPVAVENLCAGVVTPAHDKCFHEDQGQGNNINNDSDGLERGRGGSASFSAALCSDRDQVVPSEGASGKNIVKAESDGRTLEIVTSSPGWLLEADVNLGAGTGVRRRVSPRAGDHSHRRGAGAGAGWAPVSPPRQDTLEMFERSDDEYDGDDRLRPRMVTFQSSSETQTKESEEGRSTFVQQSLEPRKPLDDVGWPSKDAPSSSPTHGCTDAHKPLARAGAQAGAMERVVGGTMGVVGVEAKATQHQDQDDVKGGAATAANRSRVGEKNVLGGRRIPTPPGQKAATRPLCPLRSSEAKPESEAAVKHVRQGRDLSSSDGLTGNLDIPFEELELTKLIGGGGFGQVHRGVWRGTPVAVKVLVPVAQRDLDDELASDFRAEVLMLAALRHPNVCLFMAACMAPPNRAIVTELVTRGSLWETLRKDRLPSEALISDSSGDAGGHHPLSRFRTPPGCWPWPVIMKVAEGTACGMNYLHRHEPSSILHRDLKSANLLLDESFNVKICDFGLARLKTYTNSMTGNCGTVQWMAPEVIASNKYTETADVYSFGIVCWELLSRACPYEGLNQIQVGMAVLNDRLRPEIPEWCPRDFASLIENAWHHEASRRRSFGNILRHLRSAPDPILS